jgi:hypothetical protein
VVFHDRTWNRVEEGQNLGAQPTHALGTSFGHLNRSRRAFHRRRHQARTGRAVHTLADPQLCCDWLEDDQDPVDPVATGPSLGLADLFGVGRSIQGVSDHRADATQATRTGAAIRTFRTFSGVTAPADQARREGLIEYAQPAPRRGSHRRVSCGTSNGKLGRRPPHAACSLL